MQHFHPFVDPDLSNPTFSMPESESELSWHGVDSNLIGVLGACLDPHAMTGDAHLTFRFSNLNPTCLGMVEAQTRLTYMT